MTGSETLDEGALVSQIADSGLLPEHRGSLHPGVVERLADLAREKVRVNAQDSLHLAEAALAVADVIADPQSRARGLRAKANALWFLNRNREAVELYDQALALFERCGNLTEIGRTLSSSIQPLIRLGEYAKALAGAERARQIFVDSGDALRLARLDLNVANILHRQERFREAQAAYEKAYRQLLPLRDAEGIGVALHNMAVCLIGLNDFQSALATHQAARRFCEEHGMPALVVQADYNVAYLYYLRGDYTRALRGLREAEVAARAAGDAYHQALCGLDQSEIYLEVNLNEQAAEVAQDAQAQFQGLGMNYEAGKCMVNLAIARSRLGKPASALELFSQARAIFVRETNQAWVSLIDLYQALVYYNQCRFEEARPLCESALEFFRKAGMASKEALCRLLLARLHLAASDRAGASRHCQDALAILATVEAPHLVQQAHILMGRIAEAAGDPVQAIICYQAACGAVEALRDYLRDEEIKIAFMRDKLEAYESLVRLCLERPSADSAREAFGYMEQAKSRSLRDLILTPSPAGQTGAAGELRRELNWYYRRIELEQMSPEGVPAERVEALQAEAREREKQLMRLRRDNPAQQTGPEIRSAPLLDVEAVGEALEPATVLVEYFRTGDRLLALVLGAETLEVVPLATVSQVEPIARMLNFQFSKFRLGPEYVSACQNQMLRTVQNHLRELYRALIEPIRPYLRGSHVVIVPHEFLHQLPLHALYNGNQYLCDEFTVSYAPSAAVYALCRNRKVNTNGGSLVLGVADSKAPLILEEAAAVAATLPRSELYLGVDATEQVLRDRGAVSRYIHIATHGRFRADNPMFSSIRLGDGSLTLYDLYQLPLPADLVTLSGCSTGLNVVAQGDELVGLVRGLLSAGAKSLLLSLWDVHDQSTAELMQAFYSRLDSQTGKAAALRSAMRELRDCHPHPYYWAPFVLIGGEACN
jgi:tetratricopeptide (TPR) repeat protein